MKTVNKTKMSERIVVNPREQHLDSDKAPLADDIFNGIYKAFADRAVGMGTKRKVYENGVEKEITVDPAAEFVRARFDAAASKVAPLDALAIRPAEVYDSFLQDAVTEARGLYKGRAEAMGVRIERSKRAIEGFTSRASQMVSNGEADGLTVKLFFQRMPGFKRGLSAGYNNLLRKTDEAKLDDDAKERYERAIHDNITGQKNIEEQETAPFWHVNGREQDNDEVIDRYYISPRLNGKPEEVVEVWTHTLKALGLEDRIYYKVAQGLAHRYDILLAYASPGTEGEVEKAVNEFSKRCPAGLLSDTILPSGVEVSKGIARAPEPVELNTLLRYRGQDLVSYNELVSALTELSLQRASFELIKQGIGPEQTKPRQLADAARPYFSQLVQLSGIDPSTMKAA